MSTVTGTNNDVINAAVSVANPGAQITNAEQSATAQSIVNDLASIRDSTTAGLPARVSRTGDTGMTGNYTTTGDVQARDVTATRNLVCSGTTVSLSAATVTINQPAGSSWSLAGTTTIGLGTGVLKTFYRTLRRAPVYPSDADYNAEVANGNIFILSQPAANRTITCLQASASVVENGDWMRFVMNIGSANTIDIIREGSAQKIATITGSSAIVEVQQVGGVWRAVGGAGVSVVYGADA